MLSRSKRGAKTQLESDSESQVAAGEDHADLSIAELDDFDLLSDGGRSANTGNDDVVDDDQASGSNSANQPEPASSIQHRDLQSALNVEVGPGEQGQCLILYLLKEHSK